MRTIELKVSKEKYYEQEGIISTVQLLKDVINQRQQNGYSIEEIMQRLKVLELVDKHKDDFSVNDYKSISDIPSEFFEKKINIEIEDADYEALKGWVKIMRWGLISQFIVDFVNSFNT